MEMKKIFAIFLALAMFLSTITFVFATEPYAGDSSISTDEGTDYAFTEADFNFADDDGDTLAYVKVTVLPTVGSLSLDGIAVVEDQEIDIADINSGLLTFAAAAENDYGESYDSFVFKVLDSAAEESVEEYTMTIDITNEGDAPVLGAIGDRAIDEDTEMSFTISASDADGDTLTFSMEEIDFLSPSSTLDNSVLTDNGDGTADFSWTPFNEDVGLHEVTFTVTDGTTDVSETVWLDVGNVNDDPILTDVENRQAFIDSVTGVGTEFSYQLEVSDDDLNLEGQETLSYSLTGNPAWLAVDNNGLMSGTPDGGAGEIGNNYLITVTVSDLAGSSDADTFALSILGNSAPELGSFTYVSPFNQNEIFTVDFTATDADGDAMTFSIVEDSFVADYGTTSTFDTSATLTDNGAGTASLSWTPVHNDVGTHTLTITVSDESGSTDSITFDVIVSDINDAPVADVTDQSTYEDVTLDYDFDVYDPEGDIFTYDSWDVNCDDCDATSSLDLDLDDDLFDNGDGTYGIIWTPDSDDIGTHEVSLTFIDEFNVSATYTFTIEVTEEITDEEQAVIDLEEKYDNYEDDYDDLYDDYEDAEDDNDDDEIEDLEEDLENLDDDLKDLDSDVDDLQSELDDNDEISESLKSDLLDRLEDLEEDIADLRTDIEELIDDGTSGSSSSHVSSTSGESATETSSSSSSSSSSTSTSSSDDDVDTVTVTSFTPSDTSDATHTSESSNFWDSWRSVAWLIAGLVIAFAFLIFMLALLLTGSKKQ